MLVQWATPQWRAIGRAAVNCSELRQRLCAFSPLQSAFLVKDLASGVGTVKSAMLRGSEVVSFRAARAAEQEQHR